MGPLRLIALLGAIAVPHIASAQGVAAWRTYVGESAARTGIPPSWIERVMRIESNGQTQIAGRPIVSPAGAMGLMQLMPTTWIAMRDLAGLGNDPFDPHDNILAGALYLRLLYDRFGYPGLFAAYNAGPGRYSLYLTGRRALPGETVRYLTAATAMPSAGERGGMAVPNGLVPSMPAPPSVFAIAPRQ